MSWPLLRKRAGKSAALGTTKRPSALARTMSCICRSRAVARLPDTLFISSRTIAACTRSSRMSASYCALSSLRCASRTITRVARKGSFISTSRWPALTDESFGSRAHLGLLRRPDHALRTRPARRRRDEHEEQRAEDEQRCACHGAAALAPQRRAGRKEGDGLGDRHNDLGGDGPDGEQHP